MHQRFKIWSSLSYSNDSDDKDGKIPNFASDNDSYGESSDEKEENIDD